MPGACAVPETGGGGICRWASGGAARRHRGAFDREHHRPYTARAARDLRIVPMDFGVLRLAAGGGAEIGLAARDFRETC